MTSVKLNGPEMRRAGHDLTRARCTEKRGHGKRKLGFAASEENNGPGAKRIPILMHNHKKALSALRFVASQKSEKESMRRMRP